MTSDILAPLARGRAAGRALAALLLAALLVLLAACSAAPAPEESPEPASESVSLPDTPVGHRSAEILEILNAAAAPREEQVEALLAPVALAEVPASQFVQVFEQLRTGSPWTLTSFDPLGDSAEAVLSGTKAAGEISMRIMVDDAEAVAMLWFGPVVPPRVPAASWEEIRENIAGLTAETGFRVTRVDGAEPEVILDVSGERSRPLGSIFKLYVLAAVVGAVEAGTLSWETALVAGPETRSFPSGELQDLPDGAEVSVREAAGKMIAISDNTATDMLMAAVGRGAVEAQLAALGHRDPAMNTPMINTRELFWLGWVAPAELRAEWAAGDAPARRALLERVPAGAFELDPAAMTEPAWTSGLDWFATADDLVALHLGLAALAETPAGEPLAEILSANPGLPIEDEGIRITAFKGGSSVGVLAGSWALEREDGARYVITSQSADAGESLVIDPMSAFAPVMDAISLLAP